MRPGNLWCGDAEVREVVEQFNRDAGYDPIHVGPLDRAAAQEALVTTVFDIGQGMGEFVYRMAPIADRFGIVDDMGVIRRDLAVGCRRHIEESTVLSDSERASILGLR